MDFFLILGLCTRLRWDFAGILEGNCVAMGLRQRAARRGGPGGSFTDYWRDDLPARGKGRRCGRDLGGLGDSGDLDAGRRPGRGEQLEVRETPLADDLADVGAAAFGLPPGDFRLEVSLQRLV